MLTLAAVPAYAGPLTGALNYVQNNLVTDVETLAIIGLGIILFSMQVRWQLVVGICAGIWVLANPQTLVSAFGGGG
jgi:hypothetical protein